MLRKRKEQEKERLKNLKDFLKDEEGMGTVEIILIIVVLIGLVIIFKTQLRDLVKKVFEKITEDSNTVMS
jgi:Flp pilus assembly pilin Flp